MVVADENSARAAYPWAVCIGHRFYNVFFFFLPLKVNELYKYNNNIRKRKIITDTIVCRRLGWVFFIFIYILFFFTRSRGYVNPRRANARANFFFFLGYTKNDDKIVIPVAVAGEMDAIPGRA